MSDGRLDDLADAIREEREAREEQERERELARKGWDVLFGLHPLPWRHRVETFGRGEVPALCIEDARGELVSADCLKPLGGILVDFVNSQPDSVESRG